MHSYSWLSESDWQYMDKDIPYEFITEKAKSTFYEHLGYYAAAVICDWLNGDPNMTPKEFSDYCTNIGNVIIAQTKDHSYKE